jgi:hypothetical protein
VQTAWKRTNWETATGILETKHYYHWKMPLTSIQQKSLRLQHFPPVW